MNVKAVGKYEGTPRSQVTPVLRIYVCMKINSHTTNYMHPFLIQLNVFPLTNKRINWNARHFCESGWTQLLENVYCCSEDTGSQPGIFWCPRSHTGKWTHSRSAGGQALGQLLQVYQTLTRCLEHPEYRTHHEQAKGTTNPQGQQMWPSVRNVMGT